MYRKAHDGGNAIVGTYQCWSRTGCCQQNACVRWTHGGWHPKTHAINWFFFLKQMNAHAMEILLAPAVARNGGNVFPCFPVQHESVSRGSSVSPVQHVRSISKARNRARIYNGIGKIQEKWQKNTSQIWHAQALSPHTCTVGNVRKLWRIYPNKYFRSHLYINCTRSTIDPVRTLTCVTQPREVAAAACANRIFSASTRFLDQRRHNAIELTIPPIVMPANIETRTYYNKCEKLHLLSTPIILAVSHIGTPLLSSTKLAICGASVERILLPVTRRVKNFIARYV